MSLCFPPFTLLTSLFVPVTRGQAALEDSASLFMTDCLSWDGTKPYSSSRQATPGASFPSINSRLAPPPVLIWVILSA